MATKRVLKISWIWNFVLHKYLFDICEIVIRVENAQKFFKKFFVSYILYNKCIKYFYFLRYMASMCVFYTEFMQFDHELQDVFSYMALEIFILKWIYFENCLFFDICFYIFYIHNWSHIQYQKYSFKQMQYYSRLEMRFALLVRNKDSIYFNKMLLSETEYDNIL